MSLILPHRVSIVRHAHVPYLWRALCTCGWYAYAPSEDLARAARDEHLREEEPFPDMDLLAP